MIEMTYSELNNPNFLQALANLTREKVPVKVAYNIKRIADAVMSQRKKIGEEYRKDIMEAFAKKNPDGTIAFEKGPDGQEDQTQFALDDSKKAEYDAAEIQFSARTVKIDRQKLYLEALQNVDMSASMLDALSPILTEMTIVVGSNEAPANAS